MMQFIHKYGSPKFFYEWSRGWQKWLTVITLLLLGYGLYQGLFVAPPDYQQGESYRIIFIHVPAAWMSMFVYAAMAFSGIVATIPEKYDEYMTIVVDKVKFIIFNNVSRKKKTIAILLESHNHVGNR